MKVCYFSDQDDRSYTVTEEYFIPTKYEVGKLYHLSWANKGCVWKLKSFDNSGNCIMETPRTKKIIQAKLIDLYHTNSDAIDNYKRRNKK